MEAQALLEMPAQPGAPIGFMTRNPSLTLHIIDSANAWLDARNEQPRSLE